jgi:membrane-associated phospholipid phosphatase
MEDPLCPSCNFLLKKLDSCPYDKALVDGGMFDMLIQFIWVASSVLPFVIILGLGIRLAKRRTPRYLLITICLVVQVAVNEVILKHLFKDPRPFGACSKSFGFPSGHASFASFFLTWLVFETLYISKHATFKKSKHYLPLRNLGLICCPLVPISRWFLNYHTVEQILCGSLIGFSVASACFYYLIEKGHQAWYEELSDKTALCETFASGDLDSESGIEKPPLIKNHSLQPMQSNSDGQHYL